ncbi:3-deoxy-D-manno-octulosonic acid transferase [Nitratidesulfovibrio vulgaris]|uniref:3-deoxy-D-manno-octulosonic acid transferase n=1 Tax=Nitratidesulfovibrio vulgaris (strain DP4) TaxID=391774 RepID=A0A0H3ABF1_NITV4|nr:glycosyltransferase N-terminal domain-containing protein [Nitratidesulfovibrio vulgaris]ABM29660.1 Three-deoxy-D-manno-octulosonic-acid transferase domain protein [Nitratidesulfovibrio vulgaris DP4]GEB80126.1 3-deoxy-D-manno-octulosonic acid transferase [Desulfovibrio desulfuricans]
MPLRLHHRALLALYGAVWRLARPVLARNRRLAHRFEERLVPRQWATPVDVWVQSASGGESYLAWELLKALPVAVAQDAGVGTTGMPGGCIDGCAQPGSCGDVHNGMGTATPSGCRADGAGMPPVRKVLLTSCTEQGLDVLHKAAAWAADERPDLDVQVQVFPFDEPYLMGEALAQAKPRAVVLLETELWPGLLAACTVAGTPVGVVNGRMTPPSLAAYLAIEGFWQAVGPCRVAAMSDDDAMRFTLLLGRCAGADGVDVMPNMKFDRVVPDVAASVTPSGAGADGNAVKCDAMPPCNGVGALSGTGLTVAGCRPDADAPGTPAPVGQVLREGASLVVFGSVREEEEMTLLPVLLRLRDERPRTDIAIAPRHMHRVEAWCHMLRHAGITPVLRSSLTTPPAPGAVIVWDTFGELGALYAAARAVFVGGSLAPLGGQNYLEPLARGVVPCVGPHLGNFEWVGGALREQGLVQVVPDAESLAGALLGQLERPMPRDKVLERFMAWAEPRRGGALRAAQVVEELLAMPTQEGDR